MNFSFQKLWIFFGGSFFLGLTVGSFFLFFPASYSFEAEIIAQQQQKEQLKTTPFLKNISVDGLAQAMLFGDDFQVVKTLKETKQYVQYQISYRSNGMRISGTLFVPIGFQEKRPLIVSNHGYYDWDKYKVGHGLLREEDLWARNGYVVFHSDYRFHGDSDTTRDERFLFDSSLHYAMDVLNGIQALQKSSFRSGIDFEKIAMVGHSMGGEIALDIAISHPNAANVYILYAAAHGNGWVNFDRWRENDPEVTKVTMTQKGNPQESPEFWNGLNNLLYLDRITRPIYFFHGGDDSTCPAIWSKSLAQELQKQGKKAFYTLYRDQPHEFRNDASRKFALEVLKILDTTFEKK